MKLVEINVINRSAEQQTIDLAVYLLSHDRQRMNELDSIRRLPADQTRSYFHHPAPGEALAIMVHDRRDGEPARVMSAPIDLDSLVRVDAVVKMGMEGERDITVSFENVVQG